MRNLKKVLSLVLCMAMMLSVMVVGAGAAFSDQKEIKNTEAVDVCAALNIINGYTDGSFRPEGTITRAEACKMICVALNGGKEPVLGTSAVASFTDTKGHWAEGYIESCVAQGIVAGVGGGKFNPNGNVTGTQFAKMLLIALGYNADNEGYVGAAWEVEVNVDASAKGLYADLAGMDPSKALSRDNAAQMVWNALNAYEVEYKYTLVSENGQLVSKLVLQDRVVAGTTDKITMMEDKYEAETYVATFNGNHDTGAAGKEGQIDVGGHDFTYNFDLKYIGEEVKVVYKESKDGVDGVDNKDTIYGVYVTGETDVVYATSDDIKSADDYTTAGKIKVNGIEYEVATPKKNDVLVVNNYGGIASVTASKANVAVAKTAFSDLSKQNGDTVKFIFNDDGKVVKAYTVQSKLGTVTAVNSEKVTINGLGTIKIADNDVYSGVAKNDVVVYTQLYKTAVADATVTVEKADVISGTVNSYKAAATGTDTVTVDGTVYNVYNEAAMPASVAGETGTTAFAKTDIGEKFDLYLVNGYVAAAVQTSESATNYSLIIAKDGNNTDDAFNPLKLRVLNAAGEKTIITVSDDSTLKNKNDYGIGDIITYTGDANNAVVTIEKDWSGDKVAATPDDGIFYDKTAKTLNGVVTTADCVLYLKTTTGDVNKNATYKAYNIRDLKDIELKNQDAAGVEYIAVTNDDGAVVAAFANLGTTPNGNTSSVVTGIVSASNGVVKVDDVYYNSYTVDVNDKQYTVNIKDIPENDTLTVGNVYAFAPSSDDLYDDSDDIVDLSTSDGAKDIDGDDYTSVTVAIKTYNESESLLTYYTSTSYDSDLNAFVGSGTTTKAVASDVAIIYVDVDNDTAGNEIGVNGFDTVTGYYNAIILIDSDGVISHIVIETSGEASI